jgi:hypothetical protein
VRRVDAGRGTGDDVAGFGLGVGDLVPVGLAGTPHLAAGNSQEAGDQRDRDREGPQRHETEGHDDRGQEGQRDQHDQHAASPGCRCLQRGSARTLARL